jgi:hypothetical protein
MKTGTVMGANFRPFLGRAMLCEFLPDRHDFRTDYKRTFGASTSHTGIFDVISDGRAICFRVSGAVQPILLHLCTRESGGWYHELIEDTMPWRDGPWKVTR